ncbi:hypothetical protein ACSQ67_024391 [Phaseolus vulgaris]
MSLESRNSFSHALQSAVEPSAASVTLSVPDVCYSVLTCFEAWFGDFLLKAVSPWSLAASCFKMAQNLDIVSTSGRH